MESKFPDSDARDRNVELSDAMSKVKLLDSSRGKLADQQKELSFDSGILSEAEFSQTFSSEIDVLSSGPSEYADKRSKSDSLSRLSSQFHEQEEHRSSSFCKCDDQAESDRMGLSTTDSGIYTDVSDRFTSDPKLEKCSKQSTGKLSSTPISSSRSEPSERSILNFILQRNDDGNTRLHAAIIEKDENTVKHLLQRIPSSSYLDIRNYDYQTCLHLSVLLNLPQTTRLLFLAGAKTDIEDINGNTALHLACQTNNLECVTALLSPLTVYERKYIVFRYQPVLDWSTEHLNEYNYDGVSCLHLAATNDDDLKVVNQLFMYGADVNISECKGGYTILHEAVESGNENLVSYILQHPAIDINKKTYGRQTAYHLSSCHPRIRPLLLVKGSEVYASEEESNSDESDEDSDEYDSE